MVSLDGISKSVFKRVFLVEKRDCRWKSKSFDCGGLVFDSSIIFIKFHNYSKIHFNKKSFRVVKSKIEMIDVDFIKVDKTDKNKNNSRS